MYKLEIESLEEKSKVNMEEIRKAETNTQQGATGYVGNSSSTFQVLPNALNIHHNII